MKKLRMYGGLFHKASSLSQIRILTWFSRCSLTSRQYDLPEHQKAHPPSTTPGIVASKSVTCFPVYALPNFTV